MLSHLSIRDIVLIERLEIDFNSGLSVLTGETGAGKSILLDALSLTLGARGDASLVQSGQQYDRVTFTTPYDEQAETDLTPPPAAGSHGGADPQLRDGIFRPTNEPDPLGRRAVLEEGIQAVLIGMAANRSLALEGQPMEVQIP